LGAEKCTINCCGTDKQIDANLSVKSEYFSFFLRYFYKLDLPLFEMRHPKAKRGYTLVSEKSYQSPLMRGKGMMKVGIDTMIKFL